MRILVIYIKYEGILNEIKFLSEARTKNNGLIEED